MSGWTSRSRDAGTDLPPDGGVAKFFCQLFENSRVSCTIFHSKMIVGLIHDDLMALQRRAQGLLGLLTLSDISISMVLNTSAPRDCAPGGDRSSTQSGWPSRQIDSTPAPPWSLSPARKFFRTFPQSSSWIRSIRRLWYCSSSSARR